MMTMAGMVLGTPQYMPPEQARGETDKFDARTDIYSLGAILYHILTLEPPINGDDVGQLLQSVAAGKVAAQVASHGPKRVPSTRALPHIPGGKIPEGLASITRKAMAMVQEDRYQTVKELQAALQNCQTAPAPTPAAGTQPAKEATPAKTGKNLMPLVITLVALVGVLIGVCCKLYIDRGRAETELHSKK